MTISTTSNKITYQGNGATTTFSFPFPGVAAADIQVYYTDASGVITQLASNLYSVSLNAPISPNPTGIGGSVTYPLTGSAIATGTQLTILRVLPYTQPTSLSNQGTLYQNVIESSLDLLAMLSQQNSELIGRQITVAVSDPTPTALPPAAQRANQAFIFDAQGNPSVGVAPASGVISSTMAPVVAASSFPTARQLMAPIYSPIAINTTPVSADFQKTFIATAALNINLNQTNTYFNGFEITVLAIGGTVIFVPNAVDTIDSLQLGVSLVLFAGYGVTIGTDTAGTWRIKVFQVTNGAIVPSARGECQLALSGANLQLSRFNGAGLFINGVNQQVPSPGPTLAVTSLAAATLYYIYAVMSSGAMILEASATAYATDATFGVKVKAGDGSRTLVGMAYTDTGPAWADSATKRFVRSYYNDPGYSMLNPLTSNTGTASPGYVELTAAIRLQFICWAGETVRLEANGSFQGDTNGGNVQSTIGIDGASAEDTYSRLGILTAFVNNAFPFEHGLYKSGLSEGFHFATLLGLCTSGTGTWIGSAAAQNRAVLRGFLRR